MVLTPGPALFRFAHSYRKEGHTKIVEAELNKKHAAQLAALGRVRPNVLRDDRHSKARAEEIDEGYHGSSASDDSEGEGDDLDADGDVAMGAGGDVQDEDEDEADVQLAKKHRERVMPAEEARNHLRRLFRNEPLATSLLYGGHGPFAKTTSIKAGPSSKAFITAPIASADIFFMSLVPVPPTRFRPAARMGDIVFENSQNELLSKILQTSYRVVDLNSQLMSARKKPGPEEDAGVVMELAERTRIYGALLEGLNQLQIDVNSFMDSNKNPTIIRGGKLPPAGVKQTLEKKDGLFRKHMMVSRWLLKPSGTLP